MRTFVVDSSIFISDECCIIQYCPYFLFVVIDLDSFCDQVMVTSGHMATNCHTIVLLEILHMACQCRHAIWPVTCTILFLLSYS